VSDELDPDRLGEARSAGFAKCTITLVPRGEVLYESATWHDAIVFVTAGAVELECVSGATRRFRRGDVLCLARLPLRAVRNTGVIPARLVTISRRASLFDGVTG
jgi:hypothetical protein